MQNILLPYTKELQRLENNLEVSQGSGSYINPLQGQCKEQNRMFESQNPYMKTKKIISQFKQIDSINKQLKKKEFQKKTQNDEVKEELSAKSELIVQVPQKISQQKVVPIYETTTIKLAQPKNLDEKTKQSMDAASQRKSLLNVEKTFYNDYMDKMKQFISIQWSQKKKRRITIKQAYINLQQTFKYNIKRIIDKIKNQNQIKEETIINKQHVYQ